MKIRGTFWNYQLQMTIKQTKLKEHERIISPKYCQFHKYPKSGEAQSRPEEPLNIDTKHCAGNVNICFQYLTN